MVVECDGTNVPQGSKKAQHKLLL